MYVMDKDNYESPYINISNSKLSCIVLPKQ